MKTGKKYSNNSERVIIGQFYSIEAQQNKSTRTFGREEASGVGPGDQMDLWVDKYRPATSKSIIGQQGDKSNVNKLIIWLKNWNEANLNLAGKKRASKPAPWGTANDSGVWSKCALLSGPPGVGKTTTAHLVSKELGFDVVEMNASNTRSKRMLGECVGDILDTRSLTTLMGVTSKRVLLMDEVDGISGNEDRGGISELINLIKP